MDAGGEAHLLAAARAGDQAARGELHQLARDPVRAYLVRNLGRQAERTLTLEDLEQEAFLNAFEAMPKLEDLDTVDDFRALVLRHARWRMFKEVRRHRRFAGESAISRPMASLEEARGAEEVGDVTRSDEVDFVTAQVDRLGEKQAEVVRLRMMGSEFSSIAEELGVSESAARKRYARALAELRKLLEDSAD